MVSRNDPPAKPLRRVHCRQRLTPNPLGRRFCIKQVTRNENIFCTMIPGCRCQFLDGGVPGLNQATPNVFRQIAESLAQVEIR